MIYESGYVLNVSPDSLYQVCIVYRLVHKGSAVKLPCTSPVIAVVVILSSVPVHIRLDHVYLAKAICIYCLYKGGACGVEPVLLYYKKLYVVFLASLYEIIDFFQITSHGFFSKYMDAFLGSLYAVFGMHAARCAYCNNI